MTHICRYCKTTWTADVEDCPRDGCLALTEVEKRAIWDGIEEGQDAMDENLMWDAIEKVIAARLDERAR